MVGRVKKAARVTEVKEGTVYIDQSPRSEWIPSISPEYLKLETWLRMMEIPYEFQHVDHETLTVSANSQVPHCKIGTKDIAYSNRMISEIAQAVNKETTEAGETVPLDNGCQRAFEGLIEGRLHWVLIYMRATQANQLPPVDVFQGRFWQVLRPIANKVVASKLKTKADHQGIGRQNASDVLATGKDDLRAISAYLGEKNFMAGDQPNKLDATAFAYLSQFWYIPSDNEMKTYIKENCQNLVNYLERMKGKYWPDWEDKCRKPTPPRRTKSKEESSQVVAGQETEEKVETTTAETATATVNGCSEKEAVNGEDHVVITKHVETVEVVKTVTVEDKSGALENGVAEEQKHATTPNGGTAAEKVAE